MKTHNLFFSFSNRSLFSLLMCCLFALSIMGFSGHTLAISKQPAEAQAIVEEVVNINKANAETIASILKGIGLKKAELIVDWRNTKGQFTRIEQLLEIKGIGEKTLTLNKKKIKL